LIEHVLSNATKLSHLGCILSGITFYSTLFMPLIPISDITNYIVIVVWYHI